MEESVNQVHTVVGDVNIAAEVPIQETDVRQEKLSVMHARKRGIGSDLKHVRERSRKVHPPIQWSSVKKWGDFSWTQQIQIDYMEYRQIILRKRPNRG